MDDTTANDTDATQAQTGSAPVERDLILELNFVPEWARQPPKANHFGGEAEYTERSDYRERDGRAPRRDDRSRSSSAPPQRRFSREDRGRPASGPASRGTSSPRPPMERRDSSSAPRESYGEQRERRPPPPPMLEGWRVAFIPERKHLGGAVKQIVHTRRAYPLSDLAHIFLAQPENYLVKLEAIRTPDFSPDPLWQCKECQEVFLSRETFLSHIVSRHLDLMFDSEEILGEPPSGQFNGVARCGFSGILLGPLNHHSSREKIEELLATRFANMSEEDYRARIEVLHDEQLVAQWKEEASKRTVYYRKGTKEPEGGLSRKQAETEFVEQQAAALGQSAYRCIIPATAAQKLPDGPLKRLIGVAWQREERNPHSIVMALRPAFRHMKLASFRANSREVFITAVAPRALDPARAIETIREVLNFLREHPGCSRPQMMEQLRPGMTLESKEVSEVLSPLRWLIEKGHVIEFFNGTLAVPMR